MAFALISTGLCTVAALPLAPASLAPQAASFVLTPPGEAAVTSWPAKLQPFFLSALSNKLTPAEASYIGRFPLAVINHKQGGDQGQAEQKQISAITAIKAANDSCAAFFYLNSQIDFPELALHTEAKADGTWWLHNSDGSYAWHNGTEERRGADGEHIFDWTVPAARIAWLKTASAALAHPAVAGVFVDKAGGGCPARGVAPKHATAWARAHDKMLDKLVASTDKHIILNNAYRLSASANQSGAGQLFERWGESPDHDGLNLIQDMALLQRLHGNGQITLARAGGVRPGSGDKPDPKLCASGLAAFLVASAAPGLGFFSCQVDFASTATSGWMTELSDPVYSKQLGAPSGAAVVSGGVASRRFSGGAVAIVKSATGEGCVKWADGSVSGQCPQLRG